MKRLRLIGALACAAALLAVVPALAPASVQVGSSGWQWGNPLPQGNTLRSISFAGANGYAAGEFGTLLRTTDGGTTWSGLLSGTFTNLSDVQAIDPDAVFAAGGCVARRSNDGGATFTRVAFTPVESSCKEPFAAGWFPGGPEDPNLGLLRVDVENGEYWDPVASKLVQFFAMAKAAVTRRPPQNIGEHRRFSN